ncbi:hypothetical protein FN846DRAFT_913331 [Sphaerosporella brunnea]|uniref:RNase H type-1 domain-containing protein n=1 Tax=Sphaerosporella brunnea TaxID=1250544 RepID=A0A5J5EEE7_9PEZI|nr:hypothetical protein FN846DRAFT_913331 [Sphaerosporella brunnea]
MEDADEAAATAIMHQAPTNAELTVYSDGSRLVDGRCRYAAVIQADKETNTWSHTVKYIDENQEAYDAELFGLSAGLEMAAGSATIERRTVRWLYGT